MSRFLWVYMLLWHLWAFWWQYYSTVIEAGTDGCYCGQQVATTVESRTMLPYIWDPPILQSKSCSHNARKNVISISLKPWPINMYKQLMRPICLLRYIGKIQLYLLFMWNIVTFLIFHLFSSLFSFPDNAIIWFILKAKIYPAMARM